MTDWGKLNHAYGTAEDVPELLARMSPDGKNEVWSELWGRLCHQSTVFSASFAALPALEEAAAGWSAAERIQPLVLAAGIVAACGAPEHYLAGLEPVIDSLRALGLESVVLPGRTPTEFIYLAQSVLALEGDRLWGRSLEGLVDREFSAACPNCHARLSVGVAESRFFFALGNWRNAGTEPRTWPVRPASELAEVGRRLTAWALAAEQPEVAAQLPSLFGSGRCPSCDAELSVPEALATP